MASSQDQASASTAVETPTSAAVEPYKQSFPPEIFIVLVENMPDYLLPYLWCKFRLVCKDWKAEVEKAFREKHIHKTKVIVSSPSDHDAGQMSFARLSEDDGGLRAFFRVDPTNPVRFDNVAAIGSKISQTTPTLYRPVDGIFCLVKIKNVAISDPVMYDFKVDHANRELSFLWMPMMDQLMGEEVRLRAEACKQAESKSLSFGKPGAEHPKPTPDAESDAKKQDGKTEDKTLALKRKQGPTEEPQAKRIKLDTPDTKPEAQAIKQKINAKSETSYKRLLFYMVNRGPDFPAVIDQARESRLRKQYEICGDNFISLQNHDGRGCICIVTEAIHHTRSRFRTPGEFLEF